jgi:hypothetical protein
VGHVADHIDRARIAFQRCERALRRLDELTYVLQDSQSARRLEDEVAQQYTEWLSHAYIVGVQIDAAARAAGRPREFMTWWDGLRQHPIRSFFADQRHAALKRVDVVIVAHDIEVEPGRTVSFWAFRDGPFLGDPLVPRCQRYTDWLYDDFYAQACLRLWPWPAGAEPGPPLAA